MRVGLGHVAIALALAVAPVLAFEAATVPDRAAAASVSADSNSFVTTEVLSPALSALNTYTADAIHIGHQHVSGTTLSITASESDSRFSLTQASGSIAEGGTHTVRITTGSPLPLGTFNVPVTIDAVVLASGSDVGSFQVTRTVVVNVS